MITTKLFYTMNPNILPKLDFKINIKLKPKNFKSKDRKYIYIKI